MRGIKTPTFLFKLSIYYNKFLRSVKPLGPTSLCRLHFFFKLGIFLIKPTIFSFILTLVVISSTALTRYPLFCSAYYSTVPKSLIAWGVMGTTFPLLVLIIELNRNLPTFTNWAFTVAIFTKVTYLPVDDILFKSLVFVFNEFS